MNALGQCEGHASGPHVDQKRGKGKKEKTLRPEKLFL